MGQEKLRYLRLCYPKKGGKHKKTFLFKRIRNVNWWMVALHEIHF